MSQGEQGYHGRHQRGGQARNYQGRAILRERPERASLQHPGMKQELPFLRYLKPGGKHVSAYEVQIFLDKFKIYCQQNFISGLETIFDVVDPRYPEFNSPERPAAMVVSPIDLKIWEINYRKFRDDEEKLAEHAVKLQAAMWGNMSDDSHDKVRQTAEGSAAERGGDDPLNLIKAIRSTHLTAGRVDNTQNLVAAENQYAYIRMRDDETVDTYYRRFEAVVSCLSEAAHRAERADRIPDGEMQAFKFLEGLTAAYADYKSFHDMNIINPAAAPRSAHDVYEAVSRLNLGKANARQNAYRQGAFVTQSSNRGGRFSRHNSYHGRGGGGRYGGRGGRGACVICGDYSHWKRDCPKNTEIKSAISEVRAESSAGGGKVGGAAGGATGGAGKSKN